MSRIKKALEKEKRRKKQEHRVKLKEVLKNYDSLLEHKSFNEIQKNLDELEIPLRPTDLTTLEELEKANKAVKNIDKRISEFIDNEINNNKARFLNKMEDYFVDQLSHEKFMKLKELARTDLNMFTEIEERFAYYLEDPETYEYLFVNDSSTKDIQDGVINVMDQVMLDMGIKLTEIEKKQGKRWELNYYD